MIDLSIWPNCVHALLAAEDPVIDHVQNTARLGQHAAAAVFLSLSHAEINRKHI